MAFSTLPPLALFAAEQGVYGRLRQHIQKIAPAAKDELAQQENGMKLTPTALTLVLASSSLAMVSPAMAQYGSSAPPKVAAPPKGEAPAAEASAGEYKPNISSSARKEIVELQTAVNAKDAANIPAKLAAAQAKAKTKDDRYVIAQLQLKAAVDAQDNAAIMTAIDAVLASDVLPPANTIPLYVNLGKLQYNTKAYDKAGASFERALQIEPNNVEATVMLAEARNAQGRPAEAVTLIQKAIAARVAAGQKPEENWYKRAVKLSFDAKMPSASTIAREWVAAYPSQKNWRDAIRIYQSTSGLDDASLLDSMRLAQAAGALSGENDYFRFANTLVTKGFPGEAKAVLDQGFASKAIDKSRATFSQLYTLASTRSQGDRASLAASATAAKASADAKKAMVTGEAYYGYGDYAQAADLFRAALGKSGVDKDLANLRLGMSLARSGDKAGATAALKAAGGAQAEVASLWSTWLAQQA
jgi:tetratricopeptide (TPR) repeat protein